MTPDSVLSDSTLMAPDSVCGGLFLDGRGLWGDSLCVDSLKGLGFFGERMAYRASEDVWVTAVLLLCVFMALFVLSRSTSQMVLQIRGFLYHRDRNESLLLKSEGELHHGWLHRLMLSLVLGMAMFHFTVVLMARNSLVLHPHLLLWLNIGVVFVYLWAKGWVIRLFNWTFFSAEMSDVWVANYRLINLSKTLWMLLLVAVALYSNLPTMVCISACVFVLGVHELMVLFKTRQIFFASPLGLLGAISYFCTLELMPIFFVWVSLRQINDFLLA